MIPSCPFGNAFANFNPRIQISSFMDSLQAGLLKTVKPTFLGVLEAKKNEKREHQIG